MGKRAASSQLEQAKMTLSDTFNLIAWNVNGLRARMKNQCIQNLISKYDPDILCLGETKIQDKHIEEVQKQLNFEFQYYNCSQAKKGYSGVAFLSKMQPINVSYGMGIEKHDQEGRLITAEFEKFFVISVYVPNSGDRCRRLKYRTQEWDKDFRKYLNELQNQKPAILLGDLNVSHLEIDVYDPVQVEGYPCFTKEERAEMVELLKTFADTFRELYPYKVQFTYWPKRKKVAKVTNRGWRLDYGLVSRAFMNSLKDNIAIEEVTDSDHCPVLLKFDKIKLNDL